MRKGRNWRNWQRWAPAAVLFCVGATASVASGNSPPSLIQVSDRLRPIGGLPVEQCGQFREPVAFAQTPDGHYLILDRRNHTVAMVDRTKARLDILMRAGMERGNVLQPAALSVSAEGAFAVSDAPFSQERVQMYFADGTPLGAFLLPGTASPRLTIGGVILNGTGAMQFTGRNILLNVPESGALVSVLDLNGRVVRTIGALRATGHEADREVHLALNVGLPLATSDGGLLFVFQTGVPLFRKYAADGTLEFERHIEGPALDGYLQTLPTAWPTRTIGDGTYPVVQPIVRTAAVSPGGDLWVSLVPPFTYVYDAVGDKRRTVQFDATGPLAPASLFFSRASGDLRLLVMPGCYEFAPGR